MNYTIERLLERQILNELYLNALAIKGEGQEVESAMSNSIDQLDDIIDLIYDKYPEIEGYVVVSELVEYFLELIDNETLKKFGVDGYAGYADYAELVADVVIRFVEGYNKIIAGSD